MIPTADHRPQVSVVIPVFNGASRIEECLDHLFASSFKDFEVILIDDGSTDGTVEKISRYSVAILKNGVNRGAAYSRNVGITSARGNIILFIDSDVLIPSDLIQKAVTLLAERSDIDILQGGYSAEPYYFNLFSRYKNLIFAFRAHEASGQYVNYVHTACAAGVRIYADGNFLVRHKKRFTFF